MSQVGLENTSSIVAHKFASAWKGKQWEMNVELQKEKKETERVCVCVFKKRERK